MKNWTILTHKTLRCIYAGIIVAVALLPARSFTAEAEDADSLTDVIRPAAVAVTVDAGSLRSLDTYLSPLYYNGPSFRIGFERMRATAFRPDDWMTQITGGVTYARPENPAGNNTLQQAVADASFAMLHRSRIHRVEGLTASVGANVHFDGGVTYNSRGSNNICSPQVNLSAGITCMLSYRSHIGGVPVTLRYQADIPVFGGFYLPDYDQSFYEIYLGNYRDAMNFGWWKNRFDMHNMLLLDLHFGSAALRLGYRHEFTTIWQNNISVRRSCHALVVGISWESIRLNPRKPLSGAIRSSIY